MTDHDLIAPTDTFTGGLAVVTGGGTGMGRELVRQLAADGCSIAACDINADTLAESAELARAAAAEAGHDVRVTTHRCDVADATDVEAFRAEVAREHDTEAITLLFNNAGIGGGGSFVTGDIKEWERTFSICWGGVYNCARAFLPMLVAGPGGWIVNTSSVNGFWASLGPGTAHTAYSAAKFAVKGFSEALISDLRLHAPHVHVAVVMPGHIGTDIALNTMKATRTEASQIRQLMASRGVPVDQMTDEQLEQLMEAGGKAFRDNAPMSAADAATVILDGVRAGRWRILVGDDAARLDEAVRANPERAYDDDMAIFGPGPSA